MAIELERFKDKLKVIINEELSISINKINKEYDEKKVQLKELIPKNVLCEGLIKKRKLNNNEDLINYLDVAKDATLVKCYEDFKNINDNVDSIIQDIINKSNILNYLNICSQIHVIKAKYYSPSASFRYENVSCNFLHFNNNNKYILHRRKYEKSIMNALYNLIKDFIKEEISNNIQLINIKLNEYKYIILNFNQFMNNTCITYQICYNELCKNILILQLENLFRFSPDNKQFFDDISEFFNIKCIPINDSTYCGIIIKKK